MPDKQLHIVHSASQEGIDSFRAAYTEYYRSLLFLAKNLVKDDFVAEDIVADVFAKLWEQQPDFSKYKNLRAVLYIAVKNACLNHIRLRNRRSTILGRVFGSSSEVSEEVVLNEITRAEVLRQVYDELQRLPPARRTVMELFFVEGWSKDDIANHLNISPHMVKKHRLSGIHTLRRRLGVFLLIGVFLGL